ncbi:hypothetical protein SAMN02910370_02062 [Lachnospiraceae bacterium XPB1003]|nr:hypothetical protein SAMN02910370_02062 [Lachnospiraceae bacterium XPB1003]
MSPGEWRGKNISESNRILILGESHYGEVESIGKPVPYATSGVVEEYLSHREPGGGSARWDRFFDRIAESFGYSHERSSEFYEKVWFGNYVPVLCGKGATNKAEHFMKISRREYNDSLFSFVNQNDISVIVCFSKAVFWNLPAAADEDRDSYKEISLPALGGRGNVINTYEYKAGVPHGACGIVLDEDLKIYGIRHPSAKGGFNARSVYSSLTNMEDLSDLILK